MFSNAFKSFFTNGKNHDSETQAMDLAYKEAVESKLTKLNEIIVNSHNDNGRFTSQHDIVNALESISINSNSDTDVDDDFIDIGSVDNFEESKSEISSIGENSKTLQDEDLNKNIIIRQINNLQCLFTWNLKSSNRKNIILMIQNKYGEYNINISSPEFTFERFISNLIIAYELFHKGETEDGQMKVLDIGKWLEKLDSLKIDEFYLSINVGLKHVMTGTFIHMLFATNLTEECTWLLESIASFANMEPKSKAAVYAVRASVLIEYGGNSVYLKKASDYAKKACDLDPNTSYWFYLYSLSLTAYRQFVHTIKSNPTENEKNSIQQAIALSDGKTTHYNYHRMTLDRDTVIRYFHDNKNKKDKFVHQKNIQDNQTLVHMIKTIISMEPKDPLLIVNCAKTIMTLPVMVRDFNLGKQYLTKALQMAPNDRAVFEAVERTIGQYQQISIKTNTVSEKKQYQPHLKSNTTSEKKSKRSELRSNTTSEKKTRQSELRSNTTSEKKPYQTQSKSKLPKLGDELSILVKKHNRGENVVPHLTRMIVKYDGLDHCKLIAQFCSYNILFANNLKNGVEQFIWLINQPGMVNNYLITQHFSSFGTKKFNLAELICNEIRLATNASTTSSEDLLFYYKMLTKIMETCNLNIKNVDPFMKTNLIVNLSNKAATSTYEIQKSNSDSSDHDSVHKSENVKRSRNRTRPCKTTGSNYKNGDWNKRSNKKNTIPTNSNATENVKNKTHWTNSNDEMKFKIEKFFNTVETRRGVSNNSNHIPSLLPDNFRNISLLPDNLRNITTQAEINQYTQQLYENILNRRQHY